ncbi:Uncharacterised protein [Mycobacterium tuberculosis]|nr:Uncharacterised protein [Mycobacterium tuberculosis]
MAAYIIIQSLRLQLQRNVIQGFGIRTFDHRFFVDVTEQGQLILHFLCHRLLSTGHNHVWLDTQTAQFFYAMLSRFGFHFTSCLDVRYQCHVNVHHVFATNVTLNLTN